MSDLLILFPMKLKLRRRWWDFQWGIDRWQLGWIGGERAFSLLAFLGPFMISTGEGR